MPVIDIDSLGKYVDISSNARKLLLRNEKEIATYLSIRVDADTIIDADCYVVYHNVVRGPAKGGIRIDSSVTLDETRDLAERMTYKSALVGIPFGGGKSGIRLDPRRLSRFQKTALLREYCHVLRHELEHGEYIPAPDMGTNPTDMAVIYGRLDRPDVVTGKPPRIGGLPGRSEATGKGVVCVCELAARVLLGGPLRGKTAAIQGFGNVGSWTARFLEQLGARVVAVSDITRGLYADTGLEMDRLLGSIARTGSLEGVQDYDPIRNEELLALDVDILIPAAAGDQIDRRVANNVKAKMIVEGANGPITSEGDSILEQRNIPVLPDIMANSGGVIASYIEWRNAKSGSITDREETYGVISQILAGTFSRVTAVAERESVSLRKAAQIIAVEEVVEAMKDRAWI